MAAAPREIWPGRAFPRGATFDGAGVNFAVYSRVATRVEVCLYDPAHPANETGRFDLLEANDFVWHGYVPGLEPGALYGLRVHGPYQPEQGHRCNPHKLLVDPYAKAVHGQVDWKAAVQGYTTDDPAADLSFDKRDSAAGVPKGVVVSDFFDWGRDHAPNVPWSSTVIYELHVKGFTKLHPEIPDELRGTYAGLGHPLAIGHLQRLGVTAVELLPVHEAVDEGFLEEKGLRNYWGYSTLGYFAPSQQYGSRRAPGAQVSEFKAMVKALHAAGIEVILDVVYNHTAEGNHLGPTLSLRGIDNKTYYWLMPEPRHYLDFTGAGNSVNASHPEAARLIVDSLRYWVGEMHVDGFRFDLASTIGRVRLGEFDRHAPIFQIINQDPVLSRVKLIAEPWDLGMGGYQVGNFPAPWREWNDRFRNSLRRYWKGDDNLASEVGYRLAGSADLYQGERRQPQAGINFVTCHDGFTLHDLVTYGGKHNEANGEENRDGNDDNQSWNHGAEGETDDAAINELRERQKRNLLTTLFMAQGVPMLLAGDEMGRTQRGNNNAYCQDNEISWVDWKLDDRRRKLLGFTRKLIELRQKLPVLQTWRFFQGDRVWESLSKDLTWLRPDGSEMRPRDWQRPWLRSLGFMLGGDAISVIDDRGSRLTGDSLLVLMNAHHEPMRFKLPEGQAGAEWLVELDTTHDAPAGDAPSVSGDYQVAAHGMVIMRQPLSAEAAHALPAPDRVAAMRAPMSPWAGTSGFAMGEARRRAGVVMPLFSLRRKDNWGIGEIADLPEFAGWARSAGFSVLQLLPVNVTTSVDASPYAASSAFALDPVYLSLDACEDFKAAGGRQALPSDVQRRLTELGREPAVDWGGVREVKAAAIRLAFDRFVDEHWRKRTSRRDELTMFVREQRSWLDDFALFATVHDQQKKSWTDWPSGLRSRTPDAMAELRRKNERLLLQVAWVQWQLDRQWRQARRDASSAGVELMGDLPFTVAMDSSDVWANGQNFRTDLRVGAPPVDRGGQAQDWGLPAYDWDALWRSDFRWLRARAERAGALFSLLRIDHVAGYYRTYVRSPDSKEGGFFPADPDGQLRLGETIMRMFRHFGEVVAEDLGSLPDFLRPSLDRLDIPGYRVLRWEKEDGHFRDPGRWPGLSVATNSTHDTDSNADWWDHLPSEERADLIANVPALRGLDPKRSFDDQVRDALLSAIAAAASALSLVSFQNALGARERINVPGKVDPNNWRYRMPTDIDALRADSATADRLAHIMAEAKRATGNGED
ncbi:MAG TPA: glycogen debranching protein GlgX [Polyangia bacterium]|jgi:glycogen operon protein|nr:glycogen debranching protein GlgX [Polyangia bacterium]